MVCGITIDTTEEQFSFVAPYQRCSKTRKVVDEISAWFALDNYSAGKRFVYYGFHPSLYRRALLLIVGFLALAKYGETSRLALGQFMHRGDQDRSSARHFTITWGKINISLKAVFYLSCFFISMGRFSWFYDDIGDFFHSCQFILKTEVLNTPWMATSFNTLLCLYPLIFFTVMQAYVQWRFLWELLPVSGWWVGAPVIASLSLVFGLPPDLACQDCGHLKYVLSGFDIGFGDSSIIGPIVIYLLLVGGLQWLVLRRRLVGAGGWVLMPLLNVLLVPTYYELSWRFGDISIWTRIIPVIVFFIFQEMITGGYLSRTIFIRNDDRISLV